MTTMFGGFKSVDARSDGSAQPAPSSTTVMKLVNYPYSELDLGNLYLISPRV